MECIRLELEGALLLTPRVFEDDRGVFSETYNRKVAESIGLDCDFCQDNFSRSTKAGTVRGLHFQAPPMAQAKLVRVLQGSIVDVAVDARKGSKTFGKWVKATLSAENGKQLFVPRGFLHGFVTLEPNTEVAYKVDSYYDGECDGSVRWNDPVLAIEWQIGDMEPQLSDKDANAQSWDDFQSPF